MGHSIPRLLHPQVQLQICGSLMTEEQPHAMLIPIGYFLMGFSLSREFGIKSQTYKDTPRSGRVSMYINPKEYLSFIKRRKEEKTYPVRNVASKICTWT